MAISLLASRYGYSGLSAAELKIFSQNGEDGVLAEVFSRIGTSNRFFVEFGASDGVECNTRFLMEVLGWSGLYIEPSAEKFARLSERLASRSDVQTIHGVVTPENVSSLFSAADVPSEPDLVSIDIDGQDYWVWQALVAYRPRVVVIEHNAKLGPARLVERRSLASDIDEFDTFKGLAGASLQALRALGEQKGYTLVHVDLAGVNLFFVRDDLAGHFDEVVLPRGANFDLVGRSEPDYSRRRGKHAIGGNDYVEV
jgi:hypothetical protein